MAEKSFGVKEINLIGASGTPTIESPNNLNLNAVNVAISTNVSVGGTLTVSGNLSVGGTITYDDVTNIDSVGIITAREGIFLPDSKSIQFGNTLGSADGFIKSDGANFVIEGGGGGTGETYLRGRTVRIEANGGSGGFSGSIFAKVENGAQIAELHAAGTKKLETTTSGVNIDGSVNIIYFSISASGASAYRFSGGGVDTSEDNPDIYLIRGHTYRFYNTTGSNHPFAIRSAVTNSGGTDYNDGVSGNQNNYQTFTVPLNAPSNLYYQCTIHTQNMQGNIYITGGGGRETNVGITTFKEGISLNHPSSTTHYKIENTSTNGLTFARSNGTVDLAIGPSGQLGLGGATAFGSIGQVARSTVSSSGGDKQAEWASALYYPSILREMTPTSNAISYNSIPSWVEKITILFHKASLSGTNQIYVKLKNSGGTISSGYNSSSANADGNTVYTRTDSFVIGLNGASQGHSGKMEIHKIDSNGTKWISTHSLCKVSGSTNLRHGAGDLTIASGGAVTGYEIRGSGSNNFDGNSRVSIILQ